MQGFGQNNMYKSDQELECRISADVRYTVVIRACVADEMDCLPADRTSLCQSHCMLIGLNADKPRKEPGWV
jgi:hypothetical protein